MTLAFLAQGAAGAWSISEMAVAAVIILGVIALVILAARVLGFTVPQWVWQALGILIVVVVCVVAIRFVARL